MGFLNNLSWKMKLTTGFLFLAFLVGIIGNIGIWNLNTINSNGSDIYSDNLMAINNLNHIRSKFLENRSLVILLYYAQGNKEQQEALRKQISENNAAEDKYQQEYEQAHINKLSDEEKQDYDEFKTVQVNFRSMGDKMIQLLDARNYDNAEIVLGQALMADDNALSALNKLISFNEKGANQRQISNQAVYEHTRIVMLGLMGVSLLLALGIGLFLAQSLAKRLAKMVQFAQALGRGDLTQRLDVHGNDEIGQLGVGISQAATNIRELVKAIGESSQTLNAQSQELSATMEELSATMLTIQSSTEQIAQGAEELSASTEEVGASATEIQDFTKQLTTKADEGQKNAAAIKERAGEVRIRGIQAVNEAETLYTEKESRVKQALEDAKVVEEIKAMAEAIGGIAEQTNLLSLNASIEAARAGEAGRGFAVVADEVRKLAEQSQQAVGNIHHVINDVQRAFNNLVDNTQELLGFIETKVRPDYEAYAQTGTQYEEDSHFVNAMSQELASATQSMSQIIMQISQAIQDVTATSEESASSSEEISTSISQTTMAMEQVGQSAQAQAEVAGRLSELVSKFRV